MRKIILLAGLVAGGVAMSVTASANNWLLYLPAILAGSGGGTTQPPVTTESNNWLLFLPAILAGSQGGQPPVVTVPKFNDTGIILGSIGACVENGKEDCSYGRDADPETNSGTDGHAGFSFTKLAANGTELPASDTSWTCVRDNVTGLVWTDQATWNEEDKKSWDDAQTFATNYDNCGLSAGWRVPTVKELMSIVTYNEATQSTDGNYLNIPTLPVFWTGTEDANDSLLYAWNIDFNGGYLDNTAAKTNLLYVRLVHGAPLSAQLSDNGNETVTDSSTGLIWKQCLEGLSGPGCATGSTPMLYTWSNALGLDDGEWRLPNIKELQSLVEYQNSSPAINGTVFPGTPANSTVWSNSPVSELAGNAWYIQLESGYALPGLGSGSRHVRLVKDAP